MHITSARLIPDGKYPAADAVVRFGKDGLIKDRAHPIIDTETRFSPCEEAKKDCVPREEIDILRKLLT